MFLKPEERSKLDPTSDRDFYAYPRFVTHVDEGFIEQLTELYRQQLKPHTRILDLMSSWVSHLPEDMEFMEVVGHGMNEAELAKNPRLHHYFVQDLNQNPQLPLPDESFDAVLIAVSVQYLQYPEAIFAEICRILVPDGVVIVSFSNRMFYQKAIAAWREGSDLFHLALVKGYFMGAEGFGTPKIIARSASVPSFLQMLGMGAADPFFAVIARISPKAQHGVSNH
jgi:SAM-dependent methyltransferase